MTQTPCALHFTPSIRPSISRRQGEDWIPACAAKAPLRSAPRMGIKCSGAWEKSARGMTEGGGNDGALRNYSTGIMLQE
jgi:hypothetical protein